MNLPLILCALIYIFLSCFVSIVVTLLVVWYKIVCVVAMLYIYIIHMHSGTYDLAFLERKTKYFCASTLTPTHMGVHYCLFKIMTSFVVTIFLVFFFVNLVQRKSHSNETQRERDRQIKRHTYEIHFPFH